MTSELLYPGREGGATKFTAFDLKWQVCVNCVKCQLYVSKQNCEGNKTPFAKARLTVILVQRKLYYRGKYKWDSCAMKNTADVSSAQWLIFCYTQFEKLQERKCKQALKKKYQKKPCGSLWYTW